MRYAREMHPLSPGGRMHFMNYQLVRYIPSPYFCLTNLMEFLLLERRKNRIKYIPPKHFEFTTLNHGKQKKV